MSTNDPRDPCRAIAEEIWEGMSQGDLGENVIDTIEKAIRNHTVVPGLLELCSDVRYYNIKSPHAWSEIRNKAQKLDEKARGEG